MKDWVPVRCRGCDEDIVLKVLEGGGGTEWGLLAGFDKPYPYYCPSSVRLASRLTLTTLPTWSRRLV
jgi:hypothetical protein